MLRSFQNRNTWDLISQFFKTDFKLKYNNSILGFLWVLIKPLAIFAILFTITSRVFVNQSIGHYPFYLLLGTIFSSFWNEGTMSGLGAIQNKSGLILKVNFPRYIVVISATLIPVINLLINLLVFFLLLTFFKGHEKTILPIHLGWFIVSILGLYMLIFTFSLFTSILYVKFRDLLHIWELFLQMLFWMTPIVYDASKVLHDGALKTVVTQLNPLSVFITAARDAVVYQDIKNPELVGIWLLVGIIGLLLGYAYFKRSVPRVAEDF